MPPLRAPGRQYKFAAVATLLALTASIPGLHTTRTLAAGELELALRHDGERAGNYDAACRDWIETIAQRPGGPHVELLAARLTAHHDDMRAPLDLIDPLRSVLSQPSLSPRAEVDLRDLLARLLRWAGREGELEELDVSRGFVTHFAAVGPFGLGGASQLARRFPPEEEIDLQRPLQGLRRELRWRKLLQGRDPRLVSARATLAGERGVYYHLAQLNVTEAQPAAVHIECTGPLWLFVNGELLVRETADEFLTWRRSVPVGLARGWNRVLVKNEGDSFRLLLTDPTGVRLEAKEFSQELGLELHETQGDASREGVEKPATIAPWAPPLDRDAWRKRYPDAELPAGAPDALEQMALAYLCLGAGRRELAVDHVEKALEGSADDGFLQFHAGRIYRRASHLPSDHARRRRDLAFENAARRDDELVLAHVARARALLENERPAEAAQLALSIVREDGSPLAAQVLLLQIYEQQGWEFEARRQAERIEAMAPRRRDPHIYRAHLAEGRSNPDAALRHYRRALKADPRVAGTLERIAELERQRGDVQAAEHALRRWALARPRSTRPVEKLARLQADTGRVEEAVATLREAADRFVESVSVRKELARNLERLGRPEEAISVYEEIVATRPGDLATERYLRHLRGDRSAPFWEAFDEELEDWIPQIPDSSRYPRAESLAVLDIAVVRFTEDGASEEYTHQAFKLLSEASRENLANVQIAGEPVLLRTLTPDGKTLEPVDAQGGGRYVMPGLSRDGFVELAHVDRSSHRGRWQIRNGPFFFQDPSYRQPFLLSRYVLILPSGLDLELIDSALEGKDPEQFATVERREETRPDGTRVLVFETRDAPRLRPEIRMPPREHYVPNVQLLERRSWGDVAAKLSDQVLGRTRPTPRLRAFASEHAGDAGSQSASLQALARAVNETVKGDSGPADANGILLEKQGNRDVLLAALLDIAGVHSRWAFLRARPEVDPPSELEHPTTALFRQSMLLVEPDDGPPVWVTLRDRMAPLGQLPHYLRGGLALIVGQGEPLVRRLPGGSPQDSLESTEITLRVGESDAPPLLARVDLRMTSRSLPSYAVKTQLKDLDEHRRGLSLRQIAASLFAGAQVQEASLPGVAEPAVPFAISISLTAPKFVIPSRDEFLLRPIVQPMQLVRGLIRAPTRDHPYHFTGEIHRRDRTEIRIGERFTPTRIPRGVVITGPLGSYSLRYQREADRLVVEREVYLDPGTVSVDDFPALIEFCRRVDLAETQRVVLRARD